MTTQEILESVNEVKRSINTASMEEKNRALEKMAEALILASPEILEANRLDMEAAKGHITDVMLDRLYLDEGRIGGMADGIRQLISLEDPVGQVLEENTLENGLVIRKQGVPMGVIGIIYESRPNVTSDAAALALKSGNAVVLRTGKEAYQTAAAIVKALKAGISETSIDPDVVQLIEDTTRDSAYQMMKAKGYLDLLIPRGGAGLIQAVVENAIVPVIETGTGIVHVYVDRSAKQDMALSIIENAKTSRPSVCNAMEVCLVDEAIADDFLPKLKRRLVDEREEEGLPTVQLRLDEQAARVIEGYLATEEDFDSEFSDYVLAVKVVPDLEEAIHHIEAHSTHHSDAILAEDQSASNENAAI